MREALRPGLRHPTSYGCLGDHEVRQGGIQGGLLDRELYAEGLGIEFHEHIALFDAIVIVHQDALNLAGDPRGDEGDVTIYVGVVGRDRVERMKDLWNSEEDDDERQDDGDDESE